LFALWSEHRDSRQRVREAERKARLEELIERQRNLLTERDGMSSADQRAFATAQIYQVGMEIANAVAPREYKGPLATWGDG
jgi:hypothetical protein